MFKIVLLAAVAFFVGMSGAAYGQAISSDRSQELAAALDKTKYKKKEKRGFALELFVDVKNEPAVKANPVDYSGTYISPGYSLEINVSADGRVEGSGYDSGSENAEMAKFALRDAHVSGTLLTGSKVYENGHAVPFEALFTNRTVSQGKNANEITSRETLFGIGFVQSEGQSTNRIFLEGKR
jgi:hypothetical protein